MVSDYKLIFRILLEIIAPKYLAKYHSHVYQSIPKECGYNLFTKEQKGK